MKNVYADHLINHSEERFETNFTLRYKVVIVFVNENGTTIHQSPNDGDYSSRTPLQACIPGDYSSRTPLHACIPDEMLTGQEG